MKNRALQILKANSTNKINQFNQAFDLYRKTPFASAFVIRQCNFGYTPKLLETLLYDLKKGFGISDIEIHSKKQVELQKVMEKGIQLSQDLEKITQAKKIREEFSFLSNKNCPDEFKILVSDKITAYKDFCKSHKELVEKYFKGEISTETNIEEAEELQQLILDSVENFELNRRIYEELEHYRDTGKILGNHPLLRHSLQQQQLEELSPIELVKRLDKNTYNIGRAKREIAKLKEEEAIEKRKERIKNWEKENKIIEELKKKYE